MQIEDLSRVVKNYYRHDPNLRFEKKYLHKSIVGLINDLGRVGCTCINKFERQLSAGDSQLRAKIEQHIMRPEKFFFSGYGMYKGLEKVLIPSMFNQFERQKRLNVWVPNCGWGHEAYSVATEILFKIGLTSNWHIKVHATETDREMLEFCEKGRYPQEQIQPDHLLKYEHLLKTYNDDDISARNEVREIIKFTYDSIFNHNPNIKYELVVYRGFLKYFTPAFQVQIIKALSEKICPHGYLILGVTESLLGLTSAFSVVDNLRGFYQYKPFKI